MIAAYLRTETLKPAIVTIKTKMSTMLHFASVSSHRRSEPRFSTDTVLGDANHNTSVIACFVYGQIPEKRSIRMASTFPPAFQISTVL